jgi:drug/metabolite transporter (DMT)-like permease
MLLFGSLNTITTKIQFTMKSTGLCDDDGERFRKPWFGTFNMFAGMMLALVAQRLFSLLCRRRKTSMEASLLDQSPVPDFSSPGADLNISEATLSYRQKVFFVCIPSAFDLVATGLSQVGMLFLPASVWQMLRGCEIVFAAMLAVTCLKREMFAFNWLGLFLCIIGVTLVSLSNIWGGSAEPGIGDKSQLILGMTMVVLGQVVQAAQVIAEEWLLKDVDLPEVEIIGYEGMWGLILMIVIAFPVLWLLKGSDCGHMEDPFDSLAMIYNSPKLLGMVLLYIFSCATYNVTGIAVTGSLSAVHRTMLEASRTSLIWVFGLTVHYYVDDKSLFGETWTPYSWLQLLGFVVLMVGQSVYGEMLKVPWLNYPVKPMGAVEFASPGAMKLSSPLPRPKES